MPYSTDCSEVRVFPAVGFSLAGAARTRHTVKYGSHKIWPAAQKLQKLPLSALKRVDNTFFWESPQFSVLDGRNCQTAWDFEYSGPFGRQRRAWPHGADSPHFHMYRGKIGHFFEVRVFPAAQVGLCVDGPHNTLRLSAGELCDADG